MSEWSIEHDWKSTLSARADAHEIPPTHSRSTTSPNIDTRRHVLVNHRVDREFRRVCDTVLTQSGRRVAATHTDENGERANRAMNLDGNKWESSISHRCTVKNSAGGGGTKPVFVWSNAFALPMISSRFSVPRFNIDGVRLSAYWFARSPLPVA